MKTKYKYIHFVPGAGTFDPDWTIWNNKTNDYLGELKYNVKWKEHELCPEPRTGWTIQCLLDVADFIKQLPTTKGGRVQPQVSGMPPDTEQILTEIFEHVKQKSGEEHEQSEFYKKLKEGNVTDPTGLLLMKWNRDILCSLHYLEKEKQQKFEMKTIINLLEKAVKYVKSDYEDFIRRHSR